MTEREKERERRGGRRRWRPGGPRQNILKIKLQFTWLTSLGDLNPSLLLTLIVLLLFSS